MFKLITFTTALSLSYLFLNWKMKSDRRLQEILAYEIW